jgi:hypothetical protein
MKFSMTGLKGDLIKLFTSFTSYCGYEIKENYSILKTSKAGKSIFANAY